ncbi:MAG TPA: bleomycin resistance protein [Allosphingosinicella sp.]
MVDHATPNLPSADLNRTASFFAGLGFSLGFRDDGWMILSRGCIQLEFFPFEVDPLKSIASCCIRVDDLDGMYAEFSKAGIPEDCHSTPRISPPVDEPWGMRMFYVVDPDGNLLRCIQNRPVDT